MLVRPVFNILYLGINQKNNPALQDLRVRQAIAYAIDREALVRNQLPEGAVVATQFMPDTVDGYAADLQPIPYDPDQGQAAARPRPAQSNLTLNFYYPTEVTRPYMPNPTNIFTALAENLRQAGITVEPGAAAVERRLHGRRCRPPASTTCTCSAGPVTTTTPATSSARSSARDKPEFGLTDPALFAEIGAADGDGRPGRRTRRRTSRSTGT